MGSCIGVFDSVDPQCLLRTIKRHRQLQIPMYSRLNQKRIDSGLTGDTLCLTYLLSTYRIYV